MLCTLPLLICIEATCDNGVIVDADTDHPTCVCDDGYVGGGAWLSGPLYSYPACEGMASGTCIYRHDDMSTHTCRCNECDGYGVM